ncbi:MAG: hypothetical protein ACXV7J_01640 [Methylomonas sp.]
MILSRLNLLPVITMLGVGFAGCAALPPHSVHSSFAAYAESVFRHQNELSSRLMMLSESDQLPDSEVFEKAEEAMSDACYLLNEYAERENSGDSIGWGFEAKVQSSIEGCDASIQRMETLLASVRSDG